MIVVVDYENHDKEQLRKILDNTRHDYKFSILERDIMLASKLILPDPINLIKSYRKLNLMNLTNVIRMVKTPILGINNGLSMMCREFSVEKKSGLCLFDMNFQIPSIDDINEEICEGNLEIKGGTDLVKEEQLKNVIYFYKNFHPEENEYTSAAIKFKEKRYSLIYERGYSSGIILNTSRNNELFSHIIENFVKYA